jgi:hypothetical protein
MPFIPPMLATRLEDPRRIADPRYSAEPKLDGQRAQLHVRIEPSCRLRFSSLRVPELIERDIGKSRIHRGDVDRVEPPFPGAPHQTFSHLSADEDRRVARRQLARGRFEIHREIEVLAEEKGAEGIQLAPVHHDCF